MSSLPSLTPSFVALVLGSILLLCLVLYLALILLQSLRTAVHTRALHQRELQRLDLDIRAARLRLQTIEQENAAWRGVRKFTVARKVPECADTFSYYLEPHDRRAIPGFKPGQYLTFLLPLPGLAKPIVRCYSLSDCARPGHYRVTIKRCPPPPGTDHPPGKGSSWFCDAVKEGDILDVKAPAGHFYLDLEKEKPAVLISGGVGITPMIAMAHALIEANSTRELWFFFGARNSSEHMLRGETLALAKRYPHAKIHICYSRPAPGDVLDRDYQHEGRVTVELMRCLLPSPNYQFYLCGPGAFMESITDDLRAWGVPDDSVHFEAFGPASVKKAAKPEMKAELTSSPFQAPLVTFSRSSKSAPWSPEHATVLDLAETCGVHIEAGCRAGNCGACVVAIKSGEVDYINAHGADAEPGTCLACICKPRSALTLDA